MNLILQFRMINYTCLHLHMHYQTLPFLNSATCTYLLIADWSMQACACTEIPIYVHDCFCRKMYILSYMYMCTSISAGSVGCIRQCTGLYSSSREEREREGRTQSQEANSTKKGSPDLTNPVYSCNGFHDSSGVNAIASCWCVALRYWLVLQIIDKEKAVKRELREKGQNIPPQ